MGVLNLEKWSEIKNQYSALILARIASSIINDYERLAKDVSMQQQKYSCFYSQEEIIGYLQQVDLAIQALNTARSRLSQMLHKSSDNEFVYHIQPEIIIKMRGHIQYGEEEE